MLHDRATGRDMMRMMKESGKRWFVATLDSGWPGGTSRILRTAMIDDFIAGPHERDRAYQMAAVLNKQYRGSMVFIAFEAMTEGEIEREKVRSKE